MSLATSIDVLIIGVGLAFLGGNIIIDGLIIGVITLALSFIGYFIGSKLGVFLKNKARIMGGLILIIIGTKILLGHLF